MHVSCYYIMMTSISQRIICYKYLTRCNVDISFRLIQSVLSLFSKSFWCLCSETQYTTRKIPTSSSFVSKMILNKVALLVMVLVQVTFILGSEGATSAATGAPEETTGIIKLSTLQFLFQNIIYFIFN